MISSLLLSVVMLIAWTGLVSALNMSNRSQAVTARQLEMTNTIDIMTKEIRRAQAINRSGSLIPDGTTTLTDVVVQGGVNLNDLGPYGEIALYLEVPFTKDAPAICPVGTENANNAPIGPSHYDPVVYDVRNSPQGWFPPKVVTRYGRLPSRDGTIDPCSNPRANDIAIDSLADTNSNTSCASGLLAGQGGFHTCTQGDQVELLFKSAIDGVKTVESQTTVSKRIHDFSPTQAQKMSGEKSCKTESLQSAQNEDTPVKITFNNQRDSVVRLYWIDHSGQRQLFNEIQPQQSLLVNTYLTHPWVVADNISDQCTDLVMPDVMTPSVNIV